MRTLTALIRHAFSVSTGRPRSSQLIVVVICRGSTRHLGTRRTGPKIANAWLDRTELFAVQTYRDRGVFLLIRNSSMLDQVKPG